MGRKAMFRALVLTLAPCLLLTQCGIPQRAQIMVAKARAGVLIKKPKKKTKEAKPEKGLRGLMNDSQAIARSGPAGGVPGMEGMGPAGVPGTTAEGGMFDFSNVVQTQPQNFGRVGWHNSITTAVQDARRSGKPMLILFTHQNSMSAQALENTLVLSPEFRTLVSDQFIPLRINFGDTDTRRSPFYRDFKTRLEAKGYPTVVVTLPDGTEVDRIAGYNEKSAGQNSSYSKEYLQRLEKAVADSKKAALARRTHLETQRYRTWTSKDGTKVFARLDSLDANMATFTTEWGEPFKTFLNRLSDEDQAQIAQRRDEG